MSQLGKQYWLFVSTGNVCINQLLSHRKDGVPIGYKGCTFHRYNRLHDYLIDCCNGFDLIGDLCLLWGFYVCCMICF